MRAATAQQRCTRRQRDQKARTGFRHRSRHDPDPGLRLLGPFEDSAANERGEGAHGDPAIARLLSDQRRFPGSCHRLHCLYSMIWRSHNCALSVGRMTVRFIGSWTMVGVPRHTRHRCIKLTAGSSGWCPMAFRTTASFAVSAKIHHVRLSILSICHLIESPHGAVRGGKADHLGRIPLR